jgi:hypothetical protein
MEYLLIVPTDRPQLHENLAWQFSEDKRIQVLVDQRRGQRRQRERIEKHALERRRAERRHQSRPRTDWFLIAPRKAGISANSSSTIGRSAATDFAPFLRVTRFATLVLVALGFFLFCFYSTTLLVSLTLQNSF